MDAKARESYLATQVTTATPQKLRLMLVEGAIRFGVRAQSLWNDQQEAEAMEALIRCRQIVAELMAAVKDDGSPLGIKIMALYTFLFRTLTESQLNQDAAKLAEVLNVLQVERETWSQVCEKLGANQAHVTAVVSTDDPATLAAIAPIFAQTEVPNSGISFTA